MHPIIQSKRDAIVTLCQRFRVRQLEVFGSAARGRDFDPAHSDVDFLVEFEPNDGVPTLSTYFELRAELSKLVSLPVDLVMAGSVRNPFIQADIDRSREHVYAA